MHTLTHAHIQCAHKQKERGIVFEKLKVAGSFISTGELSVDLTIICSPPKIRYFLNFTNKQNAKPTYKTRYFFVKELCYYLLHEL